MLVVIVNDVHGRYNLGRDYIYIALLNGVGLEQIIYFFNLQVLNLVVFANITRNIKLRSLCSLSLSLVALHEACERDYVLLQKLCKFLLK